MTDASTREIARMSHALATARLPGDLLVATRLRVADTLGCAVGAHDSPPVQVVRRLVAAEGPPGSLSARVIGWNTPASPELAGFGNAAMARYLDYNDTFTGAAPGHPSDMIPGLLALAEAYRRTGEQLLRAIVCAYEGFGVVAKQLSVRERGWDQGVMVSIGAACGASALLGATEEQTAQAVALAVTSGAPTRASRAGALSMWKGCATASSGRIGIFSARLAAEGMTGPDRAIEGKHGLWEQVTGRFTVAPFGPVDPWVLTSSSIKLIPAEYNSHVAVELVLALRETAAPDDIASLHVATYWNGFDEIGNDPRKWEPDTRETADHSLPYLLAAAFYDGAISAESFDDAHLADPRLRAFMRRVTVSEDKELTAAWPAKVPARVEAVLRDGTSWTRSADHPRGHPRRPATTEDVERKFLALTTPHLGDDRAGAAFDRLVRLDEIGDVAEVLDVLALESRRPPQPVES